MLGLCSLLLCAHWSSPALVQAQGRSLDDLARMGTDEASEEEAAGTPAMKGVLFSKYRSNIRQLCIFLELDKRREFFTQIVAEISTTPKGCRACAPLGKLFHGSCNAARVSRGFPEESYGRSQREPHPLATDTAAELGRALADNDEVASEAAIFLKRLFDGADASPEISPAGKEYFSMIEAPLLEPLRRFMRSEESGTVRPGSVATTNLNSQQREELLNDLF